jgi:hypothetical protein
MPGRSVLLSARRRDDTKLRRECRQSADLQRQLPAPSREYLPGERRDALTHTDLDRDAIGESYANDVADWERVAHWHADRDSNRQRHPIADLNADAYPRLS